ncbi:deoxyguanosinetriphosphate triphosphohydrolase [Candidatus Nanopelagicales bacterium]|nr:deoxyguanosinetriphosphate triphosphohydrolase [Candidatus Nanopelagicales bacterium]
MTSGAAIPRGYQDSDIERWIPEPSVSRRGPFLRDRARVLHCPALRRLADKTQVEATGVSDIPRTRLTHSLEVAQVARELGASLGCDPDVVDVAGLAHDLGHPPFGHNGEAALNEFTADIGGFEGNAQTFRVLTRLEAKVPGAGLNMTRAALDACTKYPWPRPPGGGKFGVYAEDHDVFQWVRAKSPGPARCMEAEVMDWADDVAYSVHDLDDAVAMGRLVLHDLDDPQQVLAVAQTCRQTYASDASVPELSQALKGLQDLPVWVRSFDGSLAALSQVKAMTSWLIGRFCNAVEDATRARFGTEPLTRYGGSLEVPRATRLEVAMLKAITAHYVMFREGTAAFYAEQRILLLSVAEALLASDGHRLQPWARASWESAQSSDERRRLVADQIASLTDSSLQSWYTELSK